MLLAVFAEDGRRVDFSEMAPSDAVKKIVIGQPVTLYLEDVIVSVGNGTIAAIEMANPIDSPKAAIAEGLSPDLVNNLLALAIDDNASYDGIEEFFADFPVRFVP